MARRNHIRLAVAGAGKYAGLGLSRQKEHEGQNSLESLPKINYPPARIKELQEYFESIAKRRFLLPTGADIEE